MNRRSFLKSLGIGTALACVPIVQSVDNDLGIPDEGVIKCDDIITDIKSINNNLLVFTEYNIYKLKYGKLIKVII